MVQFAPLLRGWVPKYCGLRGDGDWVLLHGGVDKRPGKGKVGRETSSPSLCIGRGSDTHLACLDPLSPSLSYRC